MKLYYTKSYELLINKQCSAIYNFFEKFSVPLSLRARSKMFLLTDEWALIARSHGGAEISNFPRPTVNARGHSCRRDSFVCARCTQKAKRSAFVGPTSTFGCLAPGARSGIKLYAIVRPLRRCRRGFTRAYAAPSPISLTLFFVGPTKSVLRAFARNGTRMMSEPRGLHCNVLLCTCTPSRRLREPRKRRKNDSPAAPPH